MLALRRTHSCAVAHATVARTLKRGRYALSARRERVPIAHPRPRRILSLEVDSTLLGPTATVRSSLVRLDRTLARTQWAILGSLCPGGSVRWPQWSRLLWLASGAIVVHRERSYAFGDGKAVKHHRVIICVESQHKEQMGVL